MEEQNRDLALRAGLAEYDLDEQDLNLLDAHGESPAVILPVLAVIGRPNVGKSTLINRFLGRRAAVVQDTPGVTRDRVSYPANWRDRNFIVVDTGGWEIRVQGIDNSIAEQAMRAVEGADAVLLVIDAAVGATDTDMVLARNLQRLGKPVLLAANKVDSAMQESDAVELWSLGLGEPYPISALHGRGSGELLDAIVELLPDTASDSTAESLPRVALVGKPNVGKSSLLNHLLGQQRVVVDAAAGTTRDPVDERIELDGDSWIFVDTAGIRKHPTAGADYYATLRSAQAVDNADIAVVILDASCGITDQDVKIINLVIEAGRALVIAFNKWDLMDDEHRWMLERDIEQKLGHVSWAPQIRFSATTGWHSNRINRALKEAYRGWQTRISTGKLNAFLGELVSANPHPLRGGKQPRILYATQAGSCPPRFVIFTTGFLDPGYRRFIERRLREDYGFQGSPIQIQVRERAKKKGRKLSG